MIFFHQYSVVGDCFCAITIFCTKENRFNHLYLRAKIVLLQNRHENYESLKISPAIYTAHIQTKTNRKDRTTNFDSRSWEFSDVTGPNVQPTSP